MAASDALVTHVLPWIERQREVIQFWVETTGIGSRGHVAMSDATTW